MWQDDVAPTLSLPDLAKRLGMSYADTKAMVVEQDRLRDARAERAELKAAELRYKQGPRRVREDLGDAVPAMAMSKWKWIQLHRASLKEKGCRGGELLQDDDFTRWMLKRFEKLRIEIACAQNRVGWLPSVEMAGKIGKMERAGSLVVKG